MKQGQDEATCQFKYPKPTQTSTQLQFEQMPDGYIRTTVVTKRNDERLNSHN